MQTYNHAYIYIYTQRFPTSIFRLSLNLLLLFNGVATVPADFHKNLVYMYIDACVSETHLWSSKTCFQYIYVPKELYIHIWFVCKEFTVCFDQLYIYMCKQYVNVKLNTFWIC